MKTPRDLTGTRYGNLVVLKLSGNKICGKLTWLCLCNCGKMTEVTRNNLVSLKSYSCGCRHYRTGENSPRYKGYKDVTGSFLAINRAAAATRNILFDDVVNSKYVFELLESQKRICVGTGLPLTNVNWSLDRINSTKGYTPGNLQMTDKEYNLLKWDHSEKTVINVISKIIEFGGNLVPRPLDYNLKYLRGHGEYTGSRYFCGQRISDIKQACKRGSKKIRYLLTLDQLDNIWEKQCGRCIYTGDILNNEDKPVNFPRASLDRIDSSGNYEITNVEFVLPIINEMKNNWSKQGFIDFCMLIYNYRGLKL